MADQEVLVLRGTLEGHNGWVTSLPPLQLTQIYIVWFKR